MRTTTLQQWSKNKTAVTAARALMDGETFRSMMEVMHGEGPLTKSHLPLGSSPTDFAYAHGMQKGFEYAIKLLDALGNKAPDRPTEPEATFSKENYE